MNPHTSYFRPAALLLAIVVLALTPASKGAGVTEAWVQRSNIVVSNSQDRAYKVVRDGAGDFIVTGSSSIGTSGLDMLTLKYSGASGALLWQKRYNGPANKDDSPTALAVDGSGNVVVTGSFDNGTNTDFYTAKYAAASGALLWEQRYNGPANTNDSASAVAVDGNGNVIVTGASDNGTNSDFYTAKYAAASGALLWEQRYNGPANSDDEPRAVAVDGGGNVIVTGSSYYGTNYDSYVAKYAAASGALLWEKRATGFGQAVAVDGNGNVLVTGSLTIKYLADGTGVWTNNNNNAYGRALAVDSSGNVIVTGGSNNGTDRDFYTAKYAAASGALLWEQSYNGPANSVDFATAVALDGNGNVVVTGVSIDPASAAAGGTGDDYYTAKYAAADGALLWEQRYNGPGYSRDWASAVAVDASGNVVVTGYSTLRYGYPFANFDHNYYYTTKYAAADGAILWEDRYQGLSQADAYASAVAVDSSGNVVVAGYADGGNPTGGGTGWDFYTAKYAGTNGALLWERTYNGPANGDDKAGAMALDSSGNVIVTGYSYNGANLDFYTAKYAAANGALLWERTYTGPANHDDKAVAVAVDGNGNVIVTGDSRVDSRLGPQPGAAYYTAKYAAADGALLWEQRYNGPVDYDAPTAVVLDTSGNVVVTGGAMFDLSFNMDFYTRKYATADGALLWEKRSSAGDGTATAAALDPSGNVVVTGYLNNNYYTAKYAAATGALLWQKSYNGPANDYDQPHAMVVDGSGNVVVTGESGNGLPDYSADYYTAKYAATNGALLWAKRYNGPGNGYDYAFAVAVDGSGNVVVTGTSFNGTNNNSYGVANYDYYTAKYAAADGALLWEKRYNGPANGEDSVALGGSGSLLALGPNGRVVVAGSSAAYVGSGAIHNITTVVYREPLPPVSITLVPTGVHLQFTGVAGHNYNIERAPAVTGPWSTLATPTAPPGGLIDYTDTNPPAGAAYYRTSTP